MLKDKNVIQEIEYGNNFGYVFWNNGDFASTDYKVLSSQTNGIFVPCMKMLYNGRIQMYYMADEYRPMSSMLADATPDILINMIVNLLAGLVEVGNNGFLLSQNIDISWDKIFVDPSTLKVKLVYLPTNVKVFGSYAEFQSELRSCIIKLIQDKVMSGNGRIDKFVDDLSNGSMSVEDICSKYKGVGMHPFTASPKENRKESGQGSASLKIVAMNAPEHFEALLDREHILLGKKQEVVDIVIPFNKMISRKHCSVTCRDGSYFITDEGSANGTYVNRVKLVPHRPVPVKRGDVVRLANSDFQLV